MSRPKRYEEERVNLGVRMPAALHVRLIAAAAERELSANWLMVRAIEKFLDELIPAGEIKWTRDEISVGATDGLNEED